MSSSTDNSKKGLTDEERKGYYRTLLVARDLYLLGTTKTPNWRLNVPEANNHDGVDIEVWTEEPRAMLVAVIEVTNYTLPRTKVNRPKLKNYIKNLNANDWRTPKPLKLLILSWHENLYNCDHRRCEREGIKVVVKGYCDKLPEAKE